MVFLVRLRHWKPQIRIHLEGVLYSCVWSCSASGHAMSRWNMLQLHTAHLHGFRTMFKFYNAGLWSPLEWVLELYYILRIGVLTENPFFRKS